MLISSALRGHSLRRSWRTALASRFLSNSFLRLWSVDHRQPLPSYQPVTILRSVLDRSVMQQGIARPPLRAVRVYTTFSNPGASACGEPPRNCHKPAVGHYRNKSSIPIEDESRSVSHSNLRSLTLF